MGCNKPKYNHTAIPSVILSSLGCWKFSVHRKVTTPRGNPTTNVLFSTSNSPLLILFMYLILELISCATHLGYCGELR